MGNLHDPIDFHIYSGKLNGSIKIMASYAD